jgi:hypothetical protein
MSSDFAAQIYEEAKKLFPVGTVEVLTQPAQMSDRQPRIGAAVRLVHTPTGIAVTSEEFSTQYENFVAAAIRMRIACDERDG